MTADAQGLNEALPRLLTDILKESFLYKPILFAKSRKTTDVFASNARDKRQALAAVVPKLTHIVPCPNLVRQLAPEFIKGLKGIWSHPGDRLSMRVDPKHTMVPLPRAIHSEKDSEVVFLALYIHPALSLLGFLKAREKLQKKNSSRTYTNDEIMEYKEQGDFELYAASFGGASHIADIGVYELRSNHEATIHLPIEIKTPAAFPMGLLSRMSPRVSTTTLHRGVDVMDEIDMKRIEGWAIQFNWPGSNQNFGHRLSMKHNKVISQVWNQMVAHRKRFAILSCNDIHYCFYRKDLNSGYLYMSPPCYPTEDGLMDIIMWTFKAAGYIKEDISLPTVYDDWWKEVPKPMGLGVNMNTLPQKALSIYNKRKSRTRK